MPYTWFLFDADNTLFDYNKAESTALFRTFEQFDCAFDAAYLDAYHETIDSRTSVFAIPLNGLELTRIPSST